MTALWELVHCVTEGGHWWGGGADASHMVVGVGFLEQVILNQGLDIRTSYMKSWDKSIPRRGNRKCKTLMRKI